MPQITLATVLGYRGENVFKVFAASLSGGDITINGVTKSPEIINNDFALRGVAGYVASFELPISKAASSYSARQQGGGVITAKIPPFLSTGENGVVISANCDDAASSNSYSSAYSYARYLVDKGENVVAFLNTDDPIYADRNVADDTGFTDLAASGVPQTTLRAFDYAMMYLAQLGLLGNPTDPTTRSGHDPDRQWGYQNLPNYFEKGDHVVADNAGYSTNAKVSGQWEPAITVWDKMHGSIQPPRLSGETDITNHTFGSHWSVPFGDIKIQCMDRVTMGEGGNAAGTVAYGNTQIDEILADFDAGNEWFVWHINPHTIRFLDANNNQLTSGANEPLFNDRAAEYARLVTAGTGMQQRAATSGKKFLFNTPDHHNAQVLKHENTSGFVNESFISITNGTGFGGQNHNVGATLVTGLVYNGTTGEYLNQDYSGATRISTFTQINIIGNEPVKRLQAKLIRSDHTVLWSGEWREGQAGNLPSSLSKKTTVLN